MAYEIEKKYLIDSVPDRNFIPHSGAVRYQVSAFYTGVIPGKFECRFRKVVDEDGETRYFTTIKVGGGEQRIEIENEIEEHEYQFAMMALGIDPKMVIFKDYVKYLNVGNTGLNLEISTVDNKFSYAEIEFDGMRELRDFEKSNRGILLGLDNPQDITNSFSMSTYWLQKLQNGK